jgi:hypothetical protein
VVATVVTVNYADGKCPLPFTDVFTYGLLLISILFCNDSGSYSRLGIENTGLLGVSR